MTKEMEAVCLDRLAGREAERVGQQARLEEVVFGVRGIIIWRGCLALLERWDPSRNPNHFWALPGGKLKRGEGLRRAFERETEEEIGLTIAASHSVWVPPHQLHYNEKSVLIRLEWLLAVHLPVLTDGLPDLSFKGQRVYEHPTEGTFRPTWKPLSEVEWAELKPPGCGSIVKTYLESRTV